LIAYRARSVDPLNCYLKASRFIENSKNQLLDELASWH